jgi:hypothetical protein
MDTVQWHEGDESERARYNALAVHTAEHEGIQAIVLVTTDGLVVSEVDGRHSGEYLDSAALTISEAKAEAEAFMLGCVADRTRIVRVSIPGSFVAEYRDGEILGWTFSPLASQAGWFGPMAEILHDDEHPYADDSGIRPDDTDGPFWRAVQDDLSLSGAESPFITVRWAE